MKKVIIDTDPGHDDAMAIMLAVKSNKFDIRMITTVAGNSTIENVTRNARYILKLLGREDIPVYSGGPKPMKRELMLAVVHGKSGLEGLDPTNEANLTGNAVDKILEEVRANPGEITLITLGPLTNIAKAVQKDPATMSNLKEIVMMGGAVNVPGNEKGVSEFNMFVDPEAADIVFGLNVRKILVPLDACNHVVMTLDDFEKLDSSELYAPVMAMIKPYIKNISVDQGVAGALMYDPLTVYALLNPAVCIAKKYNIRADTGGEDSRGRIIAEEPRNDARDVVVIEKIFSEAFQRDFINALK